MFPIRLAGPRKNVVTEKLKFNRFCTFVNDVEECEFIDKNAKRDLPRRTFLYNHV